MKTSWPVIVAVLGTVASAVYASDQAATNTSPARLSSADLVWMKGGHPGPLDLGWVIRVSPGSSLRGAGVPLLGSSSNSPASTRKLLPRLNLHLGETAPSLPKPGVYEARPYTMIVVVPGPTPDDRSVHGLEGMEPRMPIIKPELRLIPRAAK